MEPRLSFVTLGVSDLGRARRYYTEVLGLVEKPSSASEQICFFELGKTWLALFPRESLAEDAGVPADGAGFRGFTLAHNVRSVEEVDQLLAAASRDGGRLVKAGHQTDWGGYSGYFADPDGFLWEVCWNPHFPHV